MEICFKSNHKNEIPSIHIDGTVEHLTINFAEAEKENESPCEAMGSLLTDLNHLSWDEINRIAAAGKARRTFAIGAKKKELLKDGRTVECQILGFDHDDLPDGRGKTPISWKFSRAYKNHEMNPTDTNNGGWDACAMNGWLNGELDKLVSDELLAVIKPVVKLSSAGNRSQDILHSISRFWIESEKEHFGRNIYSAPGEGHWYELYQQEDVPYFTEDDDGDRVCTWLRSAYYTNYSYFCFVDTSGCTSYYNASYSAAVVPGFCT